MASRVRSLAALAALWLGLVAWAPARACSMAGEYVRPSNFELVQISDAIVVATAREARPGEYGGSVVFDVGERVKGEAPATVELPGDFGSPGPSDLADIAYSHPEGHAGPCNRMTYRKGARYLLFLEKNEDGSLRGTGHAFSRINEDYAGEDSTWMRAVRRYVAVQAKAPPMEQIPLLERMLESRRGLADQPLRPAELADIQDHLASLSPYKPTAYLLAAYSALEQGRVPPHGVRGRDADREQSGAETAARLLLGEPADEEERTLEDRKRRVLTALVNGDHPDARPLFDRLAAQTPEDPAKVGLVLRFLGKNGAYDRAFHWIETRLMNRLPQLEPRVAQRLIGDVASMQGGEGEGEEPWRGNAHAAAVWPELALSLYWYQVRTFGADRAIHFGDVFEMLPHGDYRARPLLTLALARDYKAGIAEWAVSELRDESKRRRWEGLPDEAREAATDPARLPLQILLSAWEAEHAAVLEEVFCQSETRRQLLIDAFGEAADGLYADLIAKIAASDISQDARALLPNAYVRWAARNDRTIDGDEAGLLADLLREKRPAGAGIACVGKSN